MTMEIWRVPVEADRWVGPITVKDSTGAVTSFPWKVQAFLQGTYPVAAAWANPVTDPLGVTAGKGIILPPLNSTDAGIYIIGVQVNTSTSEVPVLKEFAQVHRF